jgi:hypothetical protein
MSLARIVVLATLATAGCRKAPVAQPDDRRPDAPARVDLAAYIPADTSFALFAARGMFDHPFTGTMNAEIRAKITAGLYASAMAEAEDAPDRFFREIARALGTFDDAALRDAGWLAGRSEMALYAVGLAPVFRLHIDGAKGEALIRRAALAAGVVVHEKRHEGARYLAIRLDDKDPGEVVIAIAPEQVAISLAYDPTVILGHLTSFDVPPGPSLASVWPIEPGERFLYIDPARVTPLLADRKALGRLIGGDEVPAAACLTAVGHMLQTLPRTTSGIQYDATSLGWDVAVELAPETIALLRNSALPGWTKERDIPAVRFGVGVAPYELMMRVSPFFDAMSATSAACGEGSGGGGELRMLLGMMSPLRTVQAATFEMVSLDGTEVTMSLSVSVQSVAALWTLMASALPVLGPTVPAIGDVRDLSGQIGVPAALGVGRDLLVGSFGAGAMARARALLAAEPGPRVTLLGRFDRAFFKGIDEGRYVFMGQPMKDEDSRTFEADSIMDARLDGNRLIVRTLIGEPTKR